jgi:hypothetical protein
VSRMQSERVSQHQSDLSSKPSTCRYLQTNAPSSQPPVDTAPAINHLTLQMNIILKFPLLNRPHPIPILMIIILLHSNLPTILTHALHPSDMAQPTATLIRLSNRAFLRRLVDLDARCSRGIVPELSVSPVLAFVLVRELYSKDVVDAPRDEAGTLALVKVPGVDVVGCVAGGFVGVVVAGAGEDLAAGEVGG